MTSRNRGWEESTRTKTEITWNDFSTLSSQIFTNVRDQVLTQIPLKSIFLLELSPNVLCCTVKVNPLSSKQTKVMTKSYFHILGKEFFSAGRASCHEHSLQYTLTPAFLCFWKEIGNLNVGLFEALQQLLPRNYSMIFCDLFPYFYRGAPCFRGRPQHHQWK